MESCTESFSSFLPLIHEDRFKTSCKLLLNINTQDCNVWKRGLYLSVCHLTFRREVCLRSCICRGQHSGCALRPACTVLAQVSLWLTAEGGDHRGEGRSAIISARGRRVDVSDPRGRQGKSHINLSIYDRNLSGLSLIYTPSFEIRLPLTHS